MKNKLLIIIIIFTILLTAIVTFFLLSNNAKNKQEPITSTSGQTSTKRIEEIINNSKTIILSANGFEPNIITVKPGTRVVWTNQSDADGSVNSDPYPTNVYWKFLNLGLFKSGESVTVTLNKTGKFTYHNQFKPEQTGTIIVQ